MTFLFGIVAGISLTLFLLYLRKPDRLPADAWLMALLATLVVITALLAAAAILPASVLALANGPLFLLLPAFLWLYVRRLTGHAARAEWLALLPGIAWSIWILAGRDSVAVLPAVPVLASLLYPAGGLVTIAVYRRRLLDHVSQLKGVDLNWLAYLLTVAIVGTIAGGGLVIASGQFPAFGVSALLAGVMGIVTVQLLLTAWFGLRQSALPRVYPHAIDEKSDEATLDRIRQVMMDEHLWREPDLKLSDLARRAAKTERAVSAAINQLAGQNFFRFVNGYRVTDAQRLLRDPDWADCGLMEIAFEAGFASKPSFNRIFKQVSGETPSAWRAKPERAAA
ncbi:helix-turn-helix domain-containing protein [Hyphobacterium sp.]|uniref:helix-turn-helix domain-containing protein n=1 Tax=Hyphobacterium sp. TaxID=2004662 RepID=UPI003BA9235F